CASLDNEAVVVEAGGFFLYDSRRAQRLDISHHRLIEVELPRMALESAFAGKIPSPATVTAALAHSQLTPLLRTQLAYFPQATPPMSPIEQHSLLEATEALTLLTLQGAIGNLMPADDNRDKA